MFVFVFKGFKGSINKDAGGFFHGKIKHIPDLYSYEGATIQELYSEFTVSVDKYIADENGA